MSIKTLTQNITKDTILLYLAVSVSILFFFTSIVKIDISHLVSLIIIIIFLVYFTLINNENITDLNIELEYKLNSLLEPPPDYFYTDADLINLFYNIKEDFALYNYHAYENSIKCANIVLHIKSDIEKQLCSSPKVPNIKRNFTPNSQLNHSDLELNEQKERSDFLNVNEYDFVDDTRCKSTLVNAYENYQLAEENVKKCMNYLHSFIMKIPKNPVIHRKHEKILNRVHILLKRNLDAIKKVYDKSIKNNMTSSTRLIEDYDMPKAYNKHKEHNIMINEIGNYVEGNFNFY